MQMKFSDGQSKFLRFRDFLLLVKVAQIRCMQKISVLQ